MAKRPERARRPTTRITDRPGTAPGTLVSREGAIATKLHVIAFGPERIREEEPISIDALPRPGDEAVIWINAVGMGDVALLEALGRRFDLHPLALEDAVNVNQRPKLEAFGDDLFVVVRMCHPPDARGKMKSEQLCLLVRPGLLITFQERPGDPFAGVRERLQVATRRLRNRDADYLAYALLDAVIDGYQPVLDGFEERLEAIEERLLEEPDVEDLKALHTLRRELIALRRGIAPAREVVLAMMRGTEAPETITEETQLFLRDCYDHVVRTVDQIDSFRELCASLMDMYLSTVSNRTNDVMKVLTMIATVFIPLSFMVGLYGMNFDTGSPWNMPELGARFGYPVLVAVMMLVAGGFIAYFKKKGWL